MVVVRLMDVRKELNSALAWLAWKFYNNVETIDKYASFFVLMIFIHWVTR